MKNNPQFRKRMEERQKEEELKKRNCKNKTVYRRDQPTALTDPRPYSTRRS
jgi:hypothetical protein